MTGAELKPCPFCGHRPHVCGVAGIAEVVCCNCQASSGPRLSVQDAIKDWNRRTACRSHEHPTCRIVHGEDGYDICGRCGAFIRRGTVTDCFKRLPVRYCPNCGAKVVDDE